MSAPLFSLAEGIAMPDSGEAADMSAVALARPAGGFDVHRYLTYPHANGFADRGRSIVFGQCEKKVFSFWRRWFETGVEERLGELPRTMTGAEVRWFDVAIGSNHLVVIQNNIVWRFDLNLPVACQRAEAVYREPASGGGLLGELPSLAADGSRLICERQLGGRYQILEIAISGEAGAGLRARVLLDLPWRPNHFQLCPHDETWLGFCHEGPADQVADRIWGWHPQFAPSGRCLFDNGAAKLFVGHERWAFHETTVFAVAYGVSPRAPRGVYEISPENGRVRLVSEGDRDWHVDVSRDGRWAVVDTSGPHDAPGGGWENAGDVSDVVLIDVVTGRRECIARSRFHAKHPRHLHPVFSPDGSVIFFNESGVAGEGHCIRTVANPWF